MTQVRGPGNRRIPAGQGELVGSGVDDSELQTILDTIIKSARTGQIGDGKIFVSALTQTIRIRTGETDESAV